jgi:[ribosomal protein S5]-alanine N-acetyltransferase
VLERRSLHSGTASFGESATSAELGGRLYAPKPASSYKQVASPPINSKRYVSIMSTPNGPLRLELASNGDAVHLIAALFSEEVYEQIGPINARLEAEIESQLTAFGNDALPGGQLNWAIRDCHTNACLGGLQATLNPNGNIFVGYRVRSESQCRGIATAALQMLLGDLTRRFPERALVASVHPRNAPSLRVLAKCGFEQPVVDIGSSTQGASADYVLKYESPDVRGA